MGGRDVSGVDGPVGTGIVADVHGQGREGAPGRARAVVDQAAVELVGPRLPLLNAEHGEVERVRGEGHDGLLSVSALPFREWQPNRAKGCRPLRPVLIVDGHSYRWWGCKASGLSRASRFSAAPSRHRPS